MDGWWVVSRVLLLIFLLGSQSASFMSVAYLEKHLGTYILQKMLIKSVKFGNIC